MAALRKSWWFYSWSIMCSLNLENWSYIYQSYFYVVQNLTATWDGGLGQWARVLELISSIWIVTSYLGLLSARLSHDFPHFPPPKKNLDSPRHPSHRRLKVILTHHSIKPSWQKRLMFCRGRGKKTFPFLMRIFPVIN